MVAQQKKEKAPDHGEVLNEFWGLTRSWRTRRPEMMAFAQLCVEMAHQKLPCIRHEMQHFSLLKFIAAHGQDDYADALDMVFKAYVDNGYFDLNAPLDVSTAAPFHYKPMHKSLPLEAALRNGNIHAAELLIRYGARTDIELDGMKMLEFIDARFGHQYAIPPNAANRLEARVRLTEAIMQRALRHGAAAHSPASTLPRRRAAI